MAAKSWIRNLFARPTAGTVTTRARLGVENLEGRAMLSATLGTDGVLNIVGGSGNDSVMLRSSGQDYVVTENGVHKSFPKSAVTGVAFSGNGGNDFFKNLAFGSLKVTADGGTGNDSLYGGLRDDVLRGGDGDDFLYGWDGNDVLEGGAGHDYLNGMAGADALNGGDGNDVLVSLDNGTADQVTGGAGIDTFWTDRNAVNSGFVDDNITDVTETAGVHRIQSFKNGPNRILDGKDIADPTDGTNYVRQTGPLFAAAGPTRDDIKQGDINSCYVLGVLSAVAGTEPDVIRQNIVDLGDGTYAVALKEPHLDPKTGLWGTKAQHYYRVDADLPTKTGGRLMHAKAGAEGSLWVPLMEKAYTHHKKGLNTYASIGGGAPEDMLLALGGVDVAGKSFNSLGLAAGQSALTEIDGLLQGGKTLTFTASDTKGDGTCVTMHVYDVVRVNRDANRNVTSLVVRNPWGFDGGTGNDGAASDGYVTITAAQLGAWNWGYSGGQF